MVSTSQFSERTPPDSGPEPLLGYRFAVVRSGLVALCVGLASCALTTPVLSLPSACAEPLEVVDQVDRGVALLVGETEREVRFVSAEGLREGMVLSRGVVVTACQSALYRRARAVRQRLEVTKR